MNHPLVDGNTRIAFFATDVFLRLNGWRIVAPPDAAHRHFIGLLERGQCNLEQLDAWLPASVQRLAG